MIPNVCIFLHSHDWHDYMFALVAMPRIDRYKHLKQSSGADQQPTWCQHLVPGPRMTQGLQLCLVFTPKKYSTFIDLWMREKTFMTCQCGLLHVKILTSSRQRIGWPNISHHICHYLSSFEIHCHPLLLRRPFNGSWELQAPRAENVFTRGWQKVFTSYVMTQIEGYAARQRELTFIVFHCHFNVPKRHADAAFPTGPALQLTFSMRQGSLTATNGQKLMPNLRFDCTWYRWIWWKLQGDKMR